jgi:hypothetical protein
MKEMMKRVDIIMTEWGFLAISYFMPENKPPFARKHVRT